jgi:hypothetical protein
LREGGGYNQIKIAQTGLLISTHCGINVARWEAKSKENIENLAK